STAPLRGGECSPLNFRLILTSTATKIFLAEIRSSEGKFRSPDVMESRTFPTVGAVTDSHRPRLQFGLIYSEIKLQRELDDAWLRVGCASCGGNLTGRSAGEGRVRVAG